MPLETEDAAEQLLALLKGVTDAGAWDPSTKVWSATTTPFASMAVTLAVNGLNTLAVHGSFPYDPVGITGGFGYTLVTIPFSISPGGVIIDLASQLVSVSDIDTTHDAFDLTGQIEVAKTDATEWGTFTAYGTASGGAGASGSIDFAGGSWSNHVGSDLSLVGTQIKTTAGGVFVVSLSASGAWD